MPPSVVLVTGVSRFLGSRLAARLAENPAVDHVIGVDTVPPDRALRAKLGRTRFVRADIRKPLIAKVINEGVDTVVHASITAMPREAGGRAPMKELNVIGTMQLLAACQQSPSVRRLVLRSTTAVYGASSRDPAMFTEDMPAGQVPRSGYAKDAVEVEGYVRGFARRRPDVSIAVLRLANLIGPQVDSVFSRYFAMPVVPTVLGYDPRVQMVHQDDAVEMLYRAGVEDWAGAVNVAGSGVLLLSQAIRRAGRVAVPVPQPAAGVVARLMRRAGLDFTPEQARFLNFGRVVDTTRLRTELGYRPRYTTAAAFADFIRSRPLRPVLDPALVTRTEQALLGVLGRAGGGRG